MNTVTLSIDDYEYLKLQAELFHKAFKSSEIRMLYKFPPPSYLTIANSTDEVIEAINKVADTWIKPYNELIDKCEMHNKKTFFQRLFNSKI